MSATHADPRSLALARPAREGRLAVVALLGVLVLAMLYGGWRVATAQVPRTGEAALTLTVGQAQFTVTHVERVDGLTNADLSGMGHGIQGLVLDDSTLIRVSVTVSARDHRTRFDASRLRLLSSSSRTPQAPMGGTVGAGTLSAHASVEGALSFVVPRNGAHLRLGSTGSAEQLQLLTIDQAPPGAGHMDMDMGDGTTPAPGTTHHHGKR